jgi:hypothetical protein
MFFGACPERLLSHPSTSVHARPEIIESGGYCRLRRV